MKKQILAAATIAAVLVSAAPAFADHVSIGVGFNSGGYYGPPRGYYRGYYGYPAYYGYPGYYYAPPPPTVVYAPAPVVYPSQTVVYAQPGTVVPPAVVNANQTSPTYTGPNGQTCREYQATAQVGSAPAQTYGTACLQPDGTWRIVQ